MEHVVDALWIAAEEAKGAGGVLLAIDAALVDEAEKRAEAELKAEPRAEPGTGAGRWGMESGMKVELKVEGGEAEAGDGSASGPDGGTIDEAEAGEAESLGSDREEPEEGHDLGVDEAERTAVRDGRQRRMRPTEWRRRRAEAESKAEVAAGCWSWK